MKKQTLGKTGMLITPVIYGGIVSMSDGQENSDMYVEWAIEKGINYFDVAPTYGDAQEKLGNSLIPFRKGIYLACKTAERSADGVKRDMEESMRLLHTDHFDNYQMHALGSVSDVETVFGKGGAMETMLRAKEEGITRFLGITCHSEDAALRALDLYDFDTVLFPTNWGLNLGKGIGGRLSALAQKRNFGFLGMKSLIHRTWNNSKEQTESTYPKSWCKPIYNDEKFAVTAMKYAFSLDVDAIVPPGNFEHFSFAVNHIDECLCNPLSAEDTEYLKQKLTEINEMYIF
jgi:predicted aldo/keto reductase-like oxidoreductase